MKTYLNPVRKLGAILASLRMTGGEKSSEMQGGGEGKGRLEHSLKRWHIYHKSREWANEFGDNRIGELLAVSKKAAERAAESAWGHKLPTGAWAVEDLTY